MQIPYMKVEVNPLTKKELKGTGMKKVPVVLLDGELMADSSAIISRLAVEVEASASSRWACPHSYASERVNAQPTAVGSACRAAGRADLPCVAEARPFAHLP